MLRLNAKCLQQFLQFLAITSLEIKIFVFYLKCLWSSCCNFEAWWKRWNLIIFSCQTSIYSLNPFPPIRFISDMHQRITPYSGSVTLTGPLCIYYLRFSVNTRKCLQHCAAAIHFTPVGKINNDFPKLSLWKPPSSILHITALLLSHIPVRWFHGSNNTLTILMT